MRIGSSLYGLFLLPTAGLATDEITADSSKMSLED